MEEELKKLQDQVNELKSELKKNQDIINKRINERMATIEQDNGDIYTDEEIVNLNLSSQTIERNVNKKLQQLQTQIAEITEFEDGKKVKIDEITKKINDRMEQLYKDGYSYSDVYLDSEIQKLQEEIDKIKQEKMISKVELQSAKQEYQDYKKDKQKLEKEIEEIDKTEIPQHLLEEKKQLEEEIKKLKAKGKDENDPEIKEYQSDINKINEEIEKNMQKSKDKRTKLAKVIKKMEELEGKYGKDKLTETEKKEEKKEEKVSQKNTEPVQSATQPAQTKTEPAQSVAQPTQTKTEPAQSVAQSEQPSSVNNKENKEPEEKDIEQLIKEIMDKAKVQTPQNSGQQQATSQSTPQNPGQQQATSQSTPQNPGQQQSTGQTTPQNPGQQQATSQNAPQNPGQSQQQNATQATSQNLVQTQQQSKDSSQTQKTFNILFRQDGIWCGDKWVDISKIDNLQEFVEDIKKTEKNVKLNFDLRGMSLLSRALNQCSLNKEQVKMVKDFAYENRGNANIIHGLLTKQGFMLKDFINKIKQQPLFTTKQQKQVMQLPEKAESIQNDKSNAKTIAQIPEKAESLNNEARQNFMQQIDARDSVSNTETTQTNGNTQESSRDGEFDLPLEESKSSDDER